jgi:Putative prokaryotic signal transducing protein
MNDTLGMKRLTTAPNLALATLWADLLSNAGVPTTVQRQYASSIAGEVPPDQTLPELWVQDGDRLEHARALLHELRNPRHRHWACPGCHEVIDGPFEQCWNCGGAMPN